MENSSQTYKQPLVSVIIPTYKRSDSLPVAIDSVLHQTYDAIEIIVVDDNGDNEYRAQTAQRLQPYLNNHSVKYVLHEVNQGGCQARNTGAAAAQGDYLAFLDDDDFYEPSKILTQITYLQEKGVDACLCSMFRVDEHGDPIPSSQNMARGTSLKEAILDGNFFTPMLCIKKEVFDAIQGFSEIPRFQDKYFMFKLLKHGYTIGTLEEQLFTLVEHSNERISLVNPTKVILALDILHQFEKEERSLFTKKEWKFIKHRYYYMKAYNQVSGGFINRLRAFGNITKSVWYYTGDYNVVKIFIKTIIPIQLLQKLRSS